MSIYTLVKFKCDDEHLKNHLADYFAAIVKDPSNEEIEILFKNMSVLAGGVDVAKRFEGSIEYLGELEGMDNDCRTKTVTLRFACGEACESFISAIEDVLRDLGASSIESEVVATNDG